MAVFPLNSVNGPAAPPVPAALRNVAKTTRECLWKAIRNVVVIGLTHPLQGVAGPRGARGQARSKGA
jgi:hypothetical protein